MNSPSASSLKLAGKVDLVTGGSRGIGAGVAFLASPETAYITGTVLNIDGGFGA